MDQGTNRFHCLMGMTLTPSGTLIVCDAFDNRLRRVDLSNGQVTTIEHPFERPFGVAHSSDGMLYVAAKDGLYEIRSADGVVSRLAPSFGFGHDHGRPKYFHLDERNGLLYVTTGQEVFNVSVQTAGERRAARIFPFVSLWAMTQRDRATIVPATGADEANTRAVLSRLMRLRAPRRRVVGVFGLVLRFAFE